MNRRAACAGDFRRIVSARGRMTGRNTGKHHSAIGSRDGSFYFRRNERIVGEKACDNISISSNM
ncbi:hypothetical protein C7U60_12690 [Mesorhizobium plurifarium]|nr:hypothetical protein C7U60_12690 [Mesorhizobium plurifarium]